MALSKSGKAGSNVTQLDAVRKKRSTKISPETTPRSASKKKTASKAATKPSSKSASKTRSGTKSGIKPTKGKDAAKSTEESPGKGKAAVAGKTDSTEKEVSKPRVSNRRFDTEKVERIKAAIASGNYEINFLQVADKFIEHERYA